MQKIDTRPTRSKRLKDLSGTTTIHGIAIKDHAGFIGKYVVWNCTCPRCGKDFVMRSNCRDKQKSCGCLRTETESTPQKILIRRYHHSTLRHYVQPIWEDFDRFWEDLGHRLGEDDRVYQLIKDELIGPMNYIVCDQRTLGRCGPAAKLIRVGGRLWSVRSAAELLGVSKQCVSQKLGRPGGLEELKIEIAAKYDRKAQSFNPQPEAAD